MCEYSLDDINLEELTLSRTKVEDNGTLIDEIVDKLIYPYTSELDEYMEFVKELVSNTNHPPTNQELDDFTLNIPVLLYFTSQGQETLGVKEDLAKAFKVELFNKFYGQAEGTVPDKKAYAELETRSQEITQIAYNRAYKKIRLKMELANETLQSVKKVMTRRITEYELSRIGGN